MREETPSPYPMSPQQLLEYAIETGRDFGDLATEEYKLSTGRSQVVTTSTTSTNPHTAQSNTARFDFTSTEAPINQEAKAATKNGSEPRTTLEQLTLGR